MVDRKMLTLTGYYQLACLLVGVALCVAFWRNAAIGLAMGGLLMAANFWLVRILAERVLRPGARRVLYGLALAFKLVFMLAVISLVLWLLESHVAGFVIGMGTLFVGIGLAMVHQALLPTPEAPPA